MQAKALAAAFALSLVLPCCSRRIDPSIVLVDRSDGVVPTLRAARVAEGSIRIDGRMDEPQWQRTGSSQGFVGPMNGRPERASQVNATARIAWSESHLYVGFLVNDPNPTTSASPADEDPHLWEVASAVEIMIQPGDPGDNRDYYEIQVDTRGAIWDTHFDDYNRPITPGPRPGTQRFGHQEWRSNLRSATVVDRSAGRYVMEIAVPWTAFQPTRTAVPPTPGQTWRMNLYSFRNGQSDALAWSPTLGQGNFHRSSRFGRVVFDGQ